MKFFLAIAVIFIASVVAKAATINAASPSYLDVSNAVAQAVTGDTVVVPAGAATWTNLLIIDQKGITLQGAGYYTWSTNGSGEAVLTNHTGVETIITDGVVDRNSYLMVARWSNAPTATTNIFRLTGFQFVGIPEHAQSFKGIITILGSINLQGTNNSDWRIDHCYFNKLRGRPLGIYAFRGLIDNCYLHITTSMVFDGRVPNANEQGHWSWATDIPMGTVDEGVYVETCFFTNDALTATTDAYAGARFVFRHNKLVNGSVQNHGTDSTGVYRGGRWTASYGNTISTGTSGEYAHHFRSGSGVVFSNNVSGSFPGLWRAYNYRTRDGWGPYNGASGTNVWDLNEETLYDSGTHDGTNSSPLYLVDTTKSWTPDQWQGYSVINNQSTRFGQIISNTATTILVHGSGFGNNLYWTNGNTYQIRKVLRPLDGIGIGSGDLLVAGTPPTPTAWPNQEFQPVYFWSNSGITTLSSSGDRTVIDGQNYTNAVHPTYTPLEYPHPLAGGGGGSAYTATAVNVTVQGNLIIQNEQ